MYSEPSELGGPWLQTPLTFDSLISKRVYQNDIHLVILSSNTFSGAVRNRSVASRESWNAPSPSECLPCDQTTKNVEPGRYSHRNTVFDLNSRTLKAGLSNSRSTIPSPF